MKLLWVQFISLTLALIILGGSIGMASTRYVCLDSGMEMVNFFDDEKDKDGCCPKEEQAATDKQIFKKRCCEVSVSHYRIQTETNNIFSAIKVPLLLALPSSQHFIPAALQVIFPQQLFISYFNKAPPLTGRTLLAFIHISRI